MTDATIYAYALQSGDEITGRTVTHVASRDLTRVRFVDGGTATFNPTAPVLVAASSIPDKVSIWVPPLGCWPLGCTCPMRRHPTLAGNWERVPTPALCDSCDPRLDDEG